MICQADALRSPAAPAGRATAAPASFARHGAHRRRAAQLRPTRRDCTRRAEQGIGPSPQQPSGRALRPHRCRAGGSLVASEPDFGSCRMLCARVADRLRRRPKAGAPTAVERRHRSTTQRRAQLSDWSRRRHRRDEGGCAACPSLGRPRRRSCQHARAPLGVSIARARAPSDASATSVAIAGLSPTLSAAFHSSRRSTRVQSGCCRHVASGATRRLPADTGFARVMLKGARDVRRRHRRAVAQPAAREGSAGLLASDGCSRASGEERRVGACRCARYQLCEIFWLHECRQMHWCADEQQLNLLFCFFCPRARTFFQGG